MRTLLAGTFFFLVAACGPACAFDGPGPFNANDTKSTAVVRRLNSIIIDRFGVEEGPASAKSIRQQLAYLTSRSKQLDPAHLGVTLRLRESPTDPQPPAPPPPIASIPGSPPAYRPVEDWQYVRLRVLLAYICRANGLSYDIEDGEVVLFHPAQKAIVL
jgi:hypothetical protein